MNIIMVLAAVAIFSIFGAFLMLIIGHEENIKHFVQITIVLLIVGIAAIASGLFITRWDEKTNGVELTGTVTEIYAAKGSYGCTEWLAEVETSDGKTYTVTLGTGSRSKYQSLSDFVLEGDTVTGFVAPVIGRDAIYDGNIRSISRD